MRCLVAELEAKNAKQQAEKALDRHRTAEPRRTTALAWGGAMQEEARAEEKSLLDKDATKTQNSERAAQQGRRDLPLQASAPLVHPYDERAQPPMQESKFKFSSLPREMPERRKIDSRALFRSKGTRRTRGGINGCNRGGANCGEGCKTAPVNEDQGQRFCRQSSAASRGKNQEVFISPTFSRPFPLSLHTFACTPHPGGLYVARR